MRWILHIDGDSFFASVETSLRAGLKGKPVVTGEERGIATAMSKEAKALGIHRGMSIYQIRKLYPQAVVIKSDYHHYGIFAHRMYNIVRRYSPLVEEYSIDECFADLSQVPDPVATARLVKADLQKELGMTFSIGLGPTKVIAKVASKWNKPDGFTVIRPEDITDFVRDLQVGQVWGIGPATSHKMQRMGVKTALDMIQRPREWILAHLDKHGLELWHELRGEEVYRVHHERQDDQASIQQTRTFTPPTTNKQFLFSELSRNVEGTCHKARAQHLMARRVYYFLKTQEFRYHRYELILDKPVQTPSEILRAIKGTFNSVYKPGMEYRATGVTLAGLIPEEHAQNDLFGEVLKSRSKEVYKVLDKLERRYGDYAVILGSSMQSLKKRGYRAGKVAKRFNLPFMGEVV